MINTKTLNGKDLVVSPSEVFSFLNIAGYAKGTLESTVKSCIHELSGVITPRACFSEYPFAADGSRLSLGFDSVVSADLARRLYGCRKIILLAATVGIGADRLVSRYSLTEPSRAVILQAAGAAAIEAWLDLICDELKQNRTLRERFSCGYGDFDLSVQRSIFSALNPEKHIGVTPTSSLLMTPTKSVTAVIGVE